MPLTPNALERLMLTRLNMAPALLLDYFSTLGFRAAIVGVRLGVFDALEEGPRAAAEVAAHFDIALVMNVVHGLSEDENHRLMKRVSGALNPGGRIVLLEQFAGRAPGPAVTAINRLLDLTYHLLLKGRTYRFADAAGWLTDAGFGSPKRINLRSAPGASLAVATKHA